MTDLDPLDEDEAELLGIEFGAGWGDLDATAEEMSRALADYSNDPLNRIAVAHGKRQFDLAEFDELTDAQAATQLPYLQALGRVVLREFQWAIYWRRECVRDGDPDPGVGYVELRRLPQVQRLLEEYGPDSLDRVQVTGSKPTAPTRMKDAGLSSPHSGATTSSVPLADPRVPVPDAASAEDRDRTTEDRHEARSTIVRPPERLGGGPRALNADATSLLEQSFDLLEYLSAVAREIGPKPVRDVEKHPFRLWPADVPELRGVIALGPVGERTSWLEVRRVAAPDPVAIPDEIALLVAAPENLADPNAEPRVSLIALDRLVEKQTVEEFGEDPETDVQDPTRIDTVKVTEREEFAQSLRRSIEEEFSAWVAEGWSPWAERARPIVAARALYARLYELHLRADVESATHEVAWGHLVLTCTTPEGLVRAPMLTTKAVIEVDPAEATIRVSPEQTVQLELDAIEGSGLPGVDALANLQTAFRTAPPDPWNSDERLAVRKQLIAPLGLDASLFDSLIPAPATTSPAVNDGWVLLMRPRPLRQERFYDELAHKIRDEQFLPGALASVVADKDEVDSAMRALGREDSGDDGSADRLMMPLPANQEQERIARQLARSRGVTVQGPPGTGKSHTIVNLVSHLVAQGKRVLVTAEKEQALSVLREKIPDPLRDLSIAVLGSTPSALEDLRGSAQSMQDSLSALDTRNEDRRIAELGVTIDSLRESLVRIDAALVEALRSEEREYQLPSGPAKAPQVAGWLADDREFDLIDDRVPVDAPVPITTDEMTELVAGLRSISQEDAAQAVLDLPLETWIPTEPMLREDLNRLDQLRDQVTALEESGLRVEAVEKLTLDELQHEAHDLRAAAQTLEALGGEWEERLGASARVADPALSWVIQHNSAVRAKLAIARDLAARQAGHIVKAPDGNPATDLQVVQEWSERVNAGKKVSIFSSKGLREFSSQVEVDGFPVTTSEHIELVRGLVQLRATLREAQTLMTQAYAPMQIPVPPFDNSFMFAAEQLAYRVDLANHWWTATYPELTKRLKPLISTSDPARHPESLESAASLFAGAAARLEERELTGKMRELREKLVASRGQSGASPLWAKLVSAIDMAKPEEWGSALEEAHRLFAVRGRVLRSNELLARIKRGGAPRWSATIAHSRGDASFVGEPHELPRAWERAKARTWLSALHAGSNVGALMERSHAESIQLREAIIDMASRSARVELKRNLKDRQRRALETWLTAVKRVGKGTGKNAPRFQAAAREALPAAMGAVPIWIMPIYRVMENFDPRVSELFDVVVVDESSQCDLLSLGVLALGRKAVVVGDDKQTTPERVGIQTDRIAALQDQYLHGVPEAKLLTVDESLYAISGRAFPSTIALKEHFRCVPEIIGFSNRYYNGAIQPLREVGAPQIGDPVRAVRLEGAVSLEQRSGRVNRDEAIAIADQVAACVADPAYDGLTFGVVTMMSGPHSQILQNLIRDRIGDAEFEHRRMRVGNPPVFQGDERNVVFISMVAHDNSFAATTPRYSQWANVAASRAQDQLWVYHSMDPSTLHHEDQRRALIEYAQSDGRRTEDPDLFARTESKFERDVLKQMLARGYDVEPQHRVGSYRIDFVIRIGPGERLAIECDGDQFHGPEKWDEDVRRQRVLERLGWNFWRIRASQYYLDPDEAMKSLWDRLEEMSARVAEAEEVRRTRNAAAEAQRVEELRQQALWAAAGASAEVPAERRSSDATQTSPAEVRAESTPYDDAVAPITPLPPVAPSLAPGLDSAAVREWARRNGYPVGERGRIHRDIVAVYAQAGGADLMYGQQPQLWEEASPTIRDTGGSGSDETPTQTQLEYTWAHGKTYQLDVYGDIFPRFESVTLASVIGHELAAGVRNRLRAVRPSGGRFKVDSGGTVVTLSDGELTFVTRVDRDEWFPGHIQ